MDNEAARQTSRMVFPNNAVILNIGLLGPRYAKPMGLQSGVILGRASVALRDLLHPLKGEVNKENDEPTLIVTGVFKPDANLSTALFDMVVRCDQDCISLWYPGLATGYLLGPHADKYEPFQPAFFKLPVILRPINKPIH